MTVNARLGEDGTVAVVGVGKLLHSRVKGTEGITEATQGKSKVAQGMGTMRVAIQVRISERVGEAVIVEWIRAVVSVYHKVNVKGTSGARGRDGIKGTLERSSLTRATISMDSHNEGRARIDHDMHSKKAPIWIPSSDTAGTKVIAM